MLMSMLSNPLSMFPGGIVDCGKFDLGALGLSLASLAPSLASLGNFSCGPFDFGFECKSPCQEPKKEPAKEESSASDVHGNVRCDGCNVFPIVGPRYNCTICPDFDLCAKCEASGVHPAEHPLLKMRQVPSTAVVHHGITCDGCQQSPITGIRFKCRTCPDYDLCEACEAKNVHPADHPLIKFKVEKTRHGGHHGRNGGHHGPFGGHHGPFGGHHGPFGGHHGPFGGRGHHGHPLHNLFRQAFQGGHPEARGPHGWAGRSRWLSRGAVGEAVKEIQQALKTQVDGFFGPRTEQAVKDFQTAQSLEVDGIVGPRTRAKLLPEKEGERKDVPACGRPAMASWWLARGAVGDAVKEVQQTLGIQADGFFGPRTEQAVKDFQTAHSLLADGIVGPRTRAELARVRSASTEKKEPVASAPAAEQVAPQPTASAPAVVPSAPESPAMNQLVGMGFANLELNEELLKKHNGDVEQVVAEFLGA